MQIVTRLNKVIAYSEYGYVPVGNSAICAVTEECFDDATIVTVECVPTDIDFYNYYYINGRFIKEDSNSVIREANKRKKIQLWIGTREEYKQVADEKKSSLFAIFTDDITKKDITMFKSVRFGYELNNLANEHPNSCFVVNAPNGVSISGSGEEVALAANSCGFLRTYEDGAYEATFLDGATGTVYSVTYYEDGECRFNDWAIGRFDNPTDADSLAGKGYYTINYEYHDNTYTTGLFYWDGTTKLVFPTVKDVSTNSNFHLHEYVPIVTASGNFRLEEHTSSGGVGTWYPDRCYISKVR